VHCGWVVFRRSSGIFGGCRRLFVCFRKSSTEDSRSSENDLCQYPVRLGECVLDFEIEANLNDSRRNISARALTMSLSCVTDKERVASILAWKRYTASALNLIVGGEMKVTAAWRESNFSMTATVAESYSPGVYLNWRMRRLSGSAEGMISISKAHAHPLTDHSAYQELHCRFKPRSITSTFFSTSLRALMGAKETHLPYLVSLARLGFLLWPIT
jgi:hypothetical protein